jgi:hypothetical protein
MQFAGEHKILRIISTAALPERCNYDDEDTGQRLPVDAGMPFCSPICSTDPFSSLSSMVLEGFF